VTRSPTQVLTAGYPLVYRRGSTHLVAVNPRREAASYRLPEGTTLEGLLVSGARVDGGELTLDGFGYGVFTLT